MCQRAPSGIALVIPCFNDRYCSMDCTVTLQGNDLAVGFFFGVQVLAFFP